MKQVVQRYFRYIKYTLMLAACGYLVYLFTFKIPITEVWQTLADFKFTTSYRYLGLSMIMLGLKATSMYVCLYSEFSVRSFLAVVNNFLSTQLLVRLPGGPIARAAYFRKNLTLSKSKISTAILVTGFVDLLIPVVLSSFFSLLYGKFITYSFLSLATIFFVPFILLQTKVQNLVFDFIPVTFPWRGSAQSFLAKLKHSLFIPGTLQLKSTAYILLALSFVHHLVATYQLYLLTDAVTTAITIWDSFFVYSTSTVIKLVFAFIPASAGAYETASIFLFSRVGISGAEAASITGLLRVFTFVFYLCVGLVFLALNSALHPLQSSTNEQKEYQPPKTGNEAS